METYIKDLEEKLNLSLENITLLQCELDTNKDISCEQIERLKMEIKGSHFIIKFSKFIFKKLKKI